MPAWRNRLQQSWACRSGRDRLCSRPSLSKSQPCVALLGATGLGDLGSNFGTSDPKYAGAAGKVLLEETMNRVKNAGFEVSNVSVQIVGNKPKVGPRRSEAIVTISNLMGGVPVSVTATTTDGLGFTGEGKGLSAIATAIVVKK